MKKIKLFLFALLLSYTGFSQAEFAPVGAEWHYTSFFGWLGPGVSHIKSVKDTIVAGKDCTKLTVRSVTANHDISYTEIIHQSSDSIFQVWEWEGAHTFQYLFKTEMEIGEKHVFPRLYGNIEFEVVESETLIFNNQAVKRYKLEASSIGFETFIYDRFGPEHGFLEHWLSSPVDGNDHYFRCYADNNFPQVNLSNVDCDEGLVTDVDESHLLQIDVYPNPVSDWLQISSPDYFPAINSIPLYDIAGHVFNVQLLNERINVSHLPAGFYVGQFQTPDKFYFFKFIKE